MSQNWQSRLACQLSRQDRIWLVQLRARHTWAVHSRCWSRPTVKIVAGEYRPGIGHDTTGVVKRAPTPDYRVPPAWGRARAVDGGVRSAAAAAEHDTAQAEWMAGL